ncbi:HAD-IIB family hydrolase [Metabacillus fastidiosus]|uniref:HAD family hydrolase n=1 Tax=Metabacillus fastidiosus TaxID=1458 RepID=A0ABU6NSX9_9BACI|nr:HAD family hydrolase [Metabacillus fastidiosus]MED4400249.1 HAD family hydrolase [Metabacillus fastidiosus]
MLFVFDLDGTICFKGEPISERILNALANLTKQGHEVIFASARPIRDMLPVIHKDFHHYKMIGGNGSLIYKEGKIVHSKSFISQDLNKIVDLIKEFDGTYLIDGEWNYAYTGPDDHPILRNVDAGKLAQLVNLNELTSIVKILILTSNNFEQLFEKLSDMELFINRHSNENVLDISPKGIHKWSALEALGVKRGSYIAFGNDSNDITMFQNALHTVMIGHHEELSHFAKESIDIKGNFEEEIISKLEMLSDYYTLVK